MDPATSVYPTQIFNPMKEMSLVVRDDWAGFDSQQKNGVGRACGIMYVVTRELLIVSETGMSSACERLLSRTGTVGWPSSTP